MTTPRVDFPKRWQDCPPFLHALRVCGYARVEAGADGVTRVTTAFMSDGAYLYMYELWQRGYAYGVYGEVEP